MSDFVSEVMKDMQNHYRMGTRAGLLAAQGVVLKMMRPYISNPQIYDALQTVFNAIKEEEQKYGR